MTEKSARLTEAAIRPFHDNVEMAMAATHLLEKIGTSNATSAEQAIQRWNAADAKPRKPIWPLVLAALMILVTATVIIRDSHEISRYAAWMNWARGFSLFSFKPMPIPPPAAGLSSKQKLLLYGDPSKSTKSEKKEALWRSAPENPAYYADYACAYMSDHNALPPDYFEITKRLAPQNSWFTYQAAAVEAKDAVKSKRRSGKRVAGKFVYAESRSWEILDQGRMDRALQLIHEALTQPEWNNYSTEVLKERIALLPERNFADRLDMSSILSGGASLSSIKLRILTDIIAAKAWSLAEASDAKGFQEITKAADHFIQGFLKQNSGAVLDELVAGLFASAISESFADAASKLGLKQDAARWKQISDRLEEWKTARNSRQFRIDGKIAEDGVETGGIFGGSLEMLTKQTEHMPPLTDADVKPGRLLYHEIFSRFLGYISWLLMGLFLAVGALYRFRLSAIGWRMAGRMEQLLDRKDWLWVLGVGVLFPLVYVMMINRLTPLGGRDFGMLGDMMLLPTAHFIGLILLWLIMPKQITRWRLAKSGAAVGFSSAPWLGWLAVVCALTFIPFVGWLAVSRSTAMIWSEWMKKLGLELPATVDGPIKGWITFTCFSVVILWLAISIFRALLSRPQQLVHHATISRILTRSYIAVLLLLALATVGFKASENYWFARENLGKTDPTKAGWSVYEYQVAIQMRKELREILGYDS